MNRPDGTTPLSTPVFHILLALGSESLHGYAIMQAIQEKTEGRARILPGTLYTTLGRMMDDGYVEEAPEPDEVQGDDRRRRYYRVTQAGRRVAAAEAERLAVLVRLARRERFAGDGTSTLDGI